MKALFTHSYFLRFDPKQWAQQTPYPPLGTIYAAAVLRENGWEVALHDVMFAEGAASLADSLAKEKPDLLVVYDDGFNYLTKMCLTNMREAALEMCQMAQNAGAKVVVCSSDSTDHYEKYLAQGADAVILGEGEMALLEFAQKVEAGNDVYSDMLGIAFRKDGETKVTEKRPVLRDLDSLPAPAWDLIDIAPYQNAWKQHGYFSVNMATTRGCPFKCNWCAKPIYGNRYNSHSAKYIVELMQYMQQFFSFDHIWFADDIFGLKPGWVQAFSEEMKAAGLRIPFKIQSRADLLVVENTVEALATAGCDEVWIGAESGSQKVLDAMDKGTTIAQIEESTRMMKQYGIKPCFFLQFGYPGETWEDIQATLDIVDRLQPHDIGVSVSYPLPGTKFFENVKEQLGAKANWTDSDELLLMYKGTYSSEFYKSLHRYLHRRFRAAAAKRTFLKSGNPKSAATFMYHKPLEWLENRKTQKLLAAETLA